MSLPQVAVVLAGGQSRRMQGEDKALALIGGERMIDRVVRRLSRQVEQVLLSAPHDYGTGLEAIADLPEGPAGPVGAIRAAALHLAARDVHAFVTAPVDAPFVPDDLVARLAPSAPVAMATGDGGTPGAWQPAFALWDTRAVIAALPAEVCAEKWSLRRLGEALGARAVEFPEPGALINVNTPHELAMAQALAGDAPGGPGTA
ncbi:mobA-like NTP transferase domain protein [Blastomonas sp. RAC04]|nr:mobA-like NTP transferase domain protein [Blastomonas sp. RAC04]